MYVAHLCNVPGSLTWTLFNNSCSVEHTLISKGVSYALASGVLVARQTSEELSSLILLRVLGLRCGCSLTSCRFCDGVSLVIHSITLLAIRYCRLQSTLSKDQYEYGAQAQRSGKQMDFEGIANRSPMDLYHAK